ncbi:hypothetical protein MTR67_035206 [Solanum verrucosum]|uniref:DUF4283 domain-containing protein n=1 Tax=Solanum verrucosum TaxID=315347 RepID=A0AAF0ZJL0_SOLVR|nr:hypothetical protein MTR67_035206 [Solanum verrucosum]
MENNIMYFAMGFKSYDISRSWARGESWYDWIERGRKGMSRSSFSQNTMEWLCRTLKEASKVKGNFVCRWKRQELSTQLFCARNFNNRGRYISIISVQGKNRAVLIIPETAFNVGWWDLANKLEKFIYYKNTRITNKIPTLVDKKIPYAETLRKSKWTSRGIEAATTKQDGDIIRIDSDTNLSQSETLSRSLYGQVTTNGSDSPTLSEIRRWANSNWNKTHGLNIYDMGKNCFLFEFASMEAAEHVLRGSWSWKKQSLQLQWWTPTVGAIQSRAAIKQTWVRLVGLPLHLWSNKVFKAVGEYCGGWIRTKEETQLRNHLKWARILVKGGRNSILKEVRIEFEGIGYIIQIWNEAPVKFYAGEEEIVGPAVVGNSLNQRTMSGFVKPFPALETAVQTEEHVGCSNIFEKQIQTRDWSRECPFKNSKKVKQDLGFDPLAHSSRSYFKISGPKAKKISDPFQIEIEANITTPRVIEAELVLNPGTFAEACNDRVATEEQVDDDVISIINTENKENMEIHTGGYLQLKEKEEGNDTLEDILPLNSAEDEGIMDHENMIPTWVQQNIIKLSKEFGVHFQGCEEVALNLFMKIDGKRQVTGETPGAIVPVTPKEKIPKELKNLEPSSNFISFGTRSRGGCFVNNLNEGNIVSWNVRGLNDPRKRLLIKNMLHIWRADVYCFQESKLRGDIRETIKELWANRRVKFAQLEARGPKGGIIILWGSSIWEGEVCAVGAYCITIRFLGKTQDFSWHLSGVYGPNDREERKEVWWGAGSSKEPI